MGRQRLKALWNVMPPIFKAAKPFGTATAHAESSVGHKWLTNSLMVLIMKDLPVPPTPLQTTNIQSGVKLQAHCLASYSFW